jgi:hypothetical protein
MLKVALAVTALVAAGALPASYAFSAGPPRTLEGTLLAKANSGPAGEITRRVTCKRTSGVRQTFKCDFGSVRSTRLRAAVAVTSGGLSIGWQPIEG